MSFFFPHSADTVVGALDRGLSFADDTLSTNLGEATKLFGDQFQALEDYAATQVPLLLTGTLDGAGAATIAHGITTTFGLLVAQAWCKGAAATDFVTCNVSAVGATNVTVGGGGAGEPVRVFLLYSIVPPGW